VIGGGLRGERGQETCGGEGAADAGVVGQALEGGQRRGGGGGQAVSAELQVGEPAGHAGAQGAGSGGRCAHAAGACAHGCV